MGRVQGGARREEQAVTCCDCHKKDSPWLTVAIIAICCAAVVIGVYLGRMP